jgi:hypothetical protein
VSDLFAGTRDRWIAGLCLCCSGELAGWEDLQGVVHEPEAVAEGVFMCGRCIGKNHHIDPPEVLYGLLKALVPS